MLVRTDGAFKIEREEVGLSGTERTCHYESWIHFGLVKTPRVSTQRDTSRRGGIMRRGRSVDRKNMRGSSASGRSGARM